MSDWQPIETAPRDGQWLDLWAVSDQSGAQQRIVDARWDDKAKDWFVYSYYCHLHGHTFLKNYVPTHWMPRPLPPEQAVKTGV